MTRGEILTTVLLLLLLANLVILSTQATLFRAPGNHRGFEPVQPIAFSHRLHGGELKIPCRYCHWQATKARYAGFPSSDLCLNCHRFVQATLGATQAEEKLAAGEGREAVRPFSEEIRKIYDALGIDAQQQRVRDGKPIEWIRVHTLADFVFFPHGPHTSAEVDCSICHGPVERMEQVSQFETLAMGWCVNCHRDYRGRSAGGRTLSPSLDCSSCHF